MENMIKLKYFYGDEPDRLCFYRIPKVLFTKQYFSGLSTDAKVLYGLMLDQMSMSRENRWLDDNNRVYIFFSVQRACAYLGCKKDKALKLFAELDSETGIGLIERVKRGQGRSDLIYVMSFDLPKDAEDREEIRNLRDKSSRNDSYRPKIATVNNVDNLSGEVVGKIDQSEKTTTSEPEKVVGITDRSEMPTPRTLEIRPQEVGKTDPNYNNHNDTENNYNSPVQSCHIQEAQDYDEDDDWIDHVDWSKPIKLTMEDRRTDRDLYIEMLKDQIQYDDILHTDCFRDRMDIVDGIINIIADIATTKPSNGYERINGRDYPHEVVKSRLLKMDYDTITHVLSRFKENTTKIRNMRSYLLTALYNARDEKDIQFQNVINHDLHGDGWIEKGVITA